jgi:hypothetical protein
MSYENIERPMWKIFFDNVSKTLSGQTADVQVIGIEEGDQVAGEWLRLDGLTYEPQDDALFIYAHTEPQRHVEHTIREPKEVYADVGDQGIRQLVIIEASGRKQMLTMRNPLRLPADAAS